jgi:preprotein translocase SecF subunit
MKQFQIIRPGTNIGFMASRRKFGWLSVALVGGTAILLIVNAFTRGSALNYGIDFRGGTQVQIAFQNKPGLNTAAVRKAMSRLNYKRLEVIKAGTEGNAYVIRMENPKIIGGSSKGGKGLSGVLKKRFERTSIRVVLPSKDAAKAADLIATVHNEGVKRVRDALPLVPTKEPVIRLLTRSGLDSKKRAQVVAALETKYKAKVTAENIQTLRSFKPSKSGDQVRLVFNEDVSEADIRDAFTEAKLDIAPTAGAVARRGRQEKHKIKWVVQLVGLSDKLTRQLNKELAKFVKSTGVLQNLQFALNIPPQDDAITSALRRARYGTGQPYALRITFTHKEMRKPTDVRKELVGSGMKLQQGAAVQRVGAAANKRWYADLAFRKFTPTATLKAAFDKFGGKIEKLSVRLSEKRYRASIKAAGYAADDALILRVFFKMSRASTPEELKTALSDKKVKLPIAKHRDTLARVGEAQENKWLVVLDVKGKASGMDIERKLATIGAAGITAVEIPPHGAVKSIQSVVRVGSKVGKKLRIDGILSVVYTLFFILLYIALRFDLKFAPGAVVALIHDVMITVGIWAIFWLEFNLSTIAALLTIVGYSLNDTIVVFDRIRENLSRLRDVKLEKVINTSLNETLSRTILTSITTLAAIAAILFLASGDLWVFALALTIGILVGTYSSIYIASPVVLFLDSWFAKRASVTTTTRDPSGRGDGGGGGKRTRSKYVKREKKSGDSRLRDAEAKS